MSEFRPRLASSSSKVSRIQGSSCGYSIWSRARSSTRSLLLVRAARRVEGQVAAGRVADVEVLVEPAIRRHEDAALVPGDEDLVLALRPHDREALAGRDDDHDAGAVAVRLLVARAGKTDMWSVIVERRVLDPDDVAAGAAPAEGHEAVPGAHVGEEVAVPVSPACVLVLAALA